MRSVGHPVQDSQLVLNLLHGVIFRFTNTADDIANATIFPTSVEAHQKLILKDLRHANEDKVTVGTTLVAS